MAQAGQKIERLTQRRHLLSAGEQVLRQSLDESFAPNSGEEPEAIYADAAPLERRRHFGQFFTPRPIATLMSRWVAEVCPTTVLDPAVGLGILLRQLHEYCPDAHATGIDLDALILEFAERSLRTNKKCKIELIKDDFLLWEDDRKYDAIIANPPYLRHHELNYPPSVITRIGRRSNIQLSRLTNIYGLFLVEICRRLRPGGHAAVITPGEWLNANFGLPLKSMLIERDLLRHLFYFSHAQLPFDDALTTAAILLIHKPLDKQSHAASVHTHFIFGSSRFPVGGRRR